MSYPVRNSRTHLEKRVTFRIIRLFEQSPVRLTFYMSNEVGQMFNSMWIIHPLGSPPLGDTSKSMGIQEKKWYVQVWQEHKCAHHLTSLSSQI